MIPYTPYSRQLNCSEDELAERVERLFDRSFRVGDRVRSKLSPRTGTVVELVKGRQSLRILWDGYHVPSGYFTHQVERLSTFKGASPEPSPEPSTWALLPFNQIQGAKSNE